MVCYIKYCPLYSILQGFPIKVDVPSDRILLGCKGASRWTPHSTPLHSTPPSPTFSTISLLFYPVPVCSIPPLWPPSLPPSGAIITKLAQKAVRQDLLGVMVWFCRYISTP